jgi:5-methylcytosine-specific restriction protein B
MATERIRLPERIERGRLLAAIKRIDEDGFAPHQQSTTYDLVHDGRRYPPIAVVAFAMEDFTSKSVPAAAIRGGKGT